jgi:hypothetical protein
MPAKKHLTWTRIKEFGGLWTAGDRALMPAHRAQIMSGCHPQPGGGLRAFYKVANTVNGTGLNKAYLNLTNNASSSASTPDSKQSSEVWISVEVAMADWTPSSSQVIASDFSANTGWELSLETNGKLTFLWGTGGGFDFATSTVAVEEPNLGSLSNGERIWIHVWFRANNGGSRDTRFYSSYDGFVEDNGSGGVVEDSPAGHSLHQIGTTVGGAATTNTASTAALHVGRRPDGNFPMIGKVYRIGVSNDPVGIGGAADLWMDFTNQDVGDTSFLDDQGNTWTVNSPAAITDESATLQYPVGLYLSLLSPQAGVTDHNIYLVTVDSTGPDNWQVFSRFEGAGTPRWRSFSGQFAGVSWTGQSPAPSMPTFAKMLVGEYGVDLIGLSTRDHGSQALDKGGGGVYGLHWNRIAHRYTTATMVEVPPLYGTSVIVEHQARVVAATQDRINFSAPGTADFDDPAAGFVRLNPSGWQQQADPYTNSTLTNVYEGPLVAWMVSVPPGDLVVATRDGRIYNVQGDLADPIVRELGRWSPNQSHVAVASPKGVFFIMPNQGIHQLELGGGVTNISEGLLPTIWNVTAPPEVGLGQLAATDRFLFAPNLHTGTGLSNGALVFDLEAQAWFTSTHADDATITNPRLVAQDSNPIDSGIWVMPNQTLDGDTDPILYQYRVSGVEGAPLTEERASTWEWKSAPLRDPLGRYVDIRQVQIPAYAFNADTSTLAVTVNGVTRTVTLPSGRSIQTVQFNARGKTLDVTVKAKSNNSTIEAPMVEEVAIGWKTGPQIR